MFEKQIKAERINEQLTEKRNLILLESVGSTNDYAKQNAASLQDGSVVIAKKQTAGRGRMGRSFFSRGGVYMTFIYKNLDAESVPFITCFAAVAVARAIDSVCGAETKIKWVNDLFLGSKKLCGILTEGVTDGTSKELSTTVIGIGINVDKTEFPKELQSIATSLGNEKIKCDKNQLISQIINNFADIRTELKEKSFVEAYKEKSLVTGKQVFIGNDRTCLATVLGIGDDLSLKVEQNGVIKNLNCGEISIRL